MKLIKKFCAGFCLIIGVPIFMVTTVELLASNLTPEEREESLAALFLFGVPFTGLGTWFVWDLSRQNKQQKENVEEKENERLRQIFYDLITQGAGKITIISFAQKANISGEEAKTYLDEKAQEFGADFEVSNTGSIIYKFTI
jgi:serine/threonine-protein kinase